MTTKPDLFSKEILTICKNAKAMKRLFKFAMFVALAATTFTACQKDNTEPNELGGGKLVKMTFHAGNPEIGTAVRTEMEGLTPYWSVGDVIGVSTDGTTKHAPFTNDATERAQSTTFTGKIETSDVYYAYYPYTSNGLGEAEGNKGAKIDLPSNQSPTATSFDGKADILVSQPISGEITSLKFRRLVGIAKIVLKDNTADNLLNGQHVSSLTITVSDKNLAGRCIVDLLNYTMYEPYYNGSKSIQATYTAATTYPIDGTGASYLCVYPQELAAESTLTIEVSTEGYSIKKEITLPSAIKLEAGKITTLNIGLTEEHLTAEAAGLALPFSDDFSWADNGEADGTSALALAEYPEGKYSATERTYKGIGGLKVGSGSDRGYFTTVALDLSKEFSVIVNAKQWKTDNSKLQITIGETIQTADLSDTAQDYVFNFEPQGNKATVEVKVEGKRGYIYRIDIVEGQGTVATPLDTPTGLATEVDGNMVLVGWKPVAGATSYTVSFEPATIEPKTVLHDDATAEYSEIFENLDYATEYTVSVVANPADTENYKASAPATATFTTGENPNVTYTQIKDLVDGGTYNVKDAMVVATSTNGPVLQDETGVIFAYLPSETPAVGSIVTISGTIESYGKALQFKRGATIEITGTGEVPALTATEVTATNIGEMMTAATVTPAYVKFTGTMKISDGKYYNVTFPFESSYQGSIYYPDAEAFGLAVLDGREINVEGWFINVSYEDNPLYLNVVATQVSSASEAPYITADETASFVAAGETKTISFLTDNLGSNQVFAEISGDGAGQFSVGHIGAESITVTAVENTETTAKTATLTLYIAASEGGEHLAEATVALTQAGVPSGEAAYVKVTTTPDSWEGEYLIVYENSSTSAYAFDGSLAKLDVINNYREFNISNNSIPVSSETEAIKFTIEAADGGYNIKAANGQYIYQSSNANGLEVENTPGAINTISLESNGAANIVASNAHLRFNAASDQMRFRYYKSSSYTRQKEIFLYKLNN